MDIPLAKLQHTFRARPLVVGGMAMQYYGLRKAGNDIDLIVLREDYVDLAARFPDRLKDLWGDLGVCPFEFEIWVSIALLDYAELAVGAADAGEVLVISLEKLLLLKALAMKVPKYHADLELIVGKITADRYASWWLTVPEEKRKLYLAQTT